MDWVGNNLYWTDAFYARIEVLDLDTRHRRELMRTGSDTIPTGIAVDPRTRLGNAVQHGQSTGSVIIYSCK